MRETVSEGQFVDLWHRLGSPQAIADHLGITVRNVYARRERLAQRGVRLETRSEGATPEWKDRGWTYNRQRTLDLKEGSAVVFSDAHYWPGQPSTAHRALIRVIGQVKPKAVIANGDIFDGASVSRHDPFGWGERPSVKDELSACLDRLGEVETAADVSKTGCELIWNIGNHDLRFERTLAVKAGEFEGLRFFRLQDHFPRWEFHWSTLVNGSVMVKHRYAGGIHAGYNNTLKGGLTMVTGHTHQLEAKPWGDYRGRRWGVQTGTLLDMHGPQTEYHENSPSPQCPGFAVLTFHDGQLAPPELCEVIDGKAWFRGEIVA
jgi:hypothetical protein